MDAKIVIAIIIVALIGGGVVGYLLSPLNLAALNGDWKSVKAHGAVETIIRLTAINATHTGISIPGEGGSPWLAGVYELKGTTLTQKTGFGLGYVPQGVFHIKSTTSMTESEISDPTYSAEWTKI